MTPLGTAIPTTTAVRRLRGPLDEDESQSDHPLRLAQRQSLELVSLSSAATHEPTPRLFTDARSLTRTVRTAQSEPRLSYGAGLMGVAAATLRRMALVSPSRPDKQSRQARDSEARELVLVGDPIDDDDEADDGPPPSISPARSPPVTRGGSRPRNPSLTLTLGQTAAAAAPSGSDSVKRQRKQ